MKREDDFEVRRQHIANLTDEELYARFWELTDQVVDPLLELGRKNTTPSVERSVLLRMGVSSLDWAREQDTAYISYRRLKTSQSEMPASSLQKAKAGTRLLNLSREVRNNGRIKEK